MELNEFEKFIEEVFRPTVIEKSETKYIYKIEGFTVELDLNYYLEILNKLKTFKQFETEIFSNNYYEILIKNNSNFFVSRERTYLTEDVTNKLKYQISKPTDEFLMFFIKNYLEAINKQTSQQSIRRFFDFFRLRRMKERENGQQTIFPYSVFDMLKDAIVKLETIKINSVDNYTKNQFEKNSLAYLFNIGFNTNNSIYPLKTIEEFISPIRIGFIRRGNSEHIEPPRRNYKNDLIFHYQKGISSESLDHQYLTFYHIFEHFFDSVYNEDLVNKVRDEITLPSFSYKKDKDIRNLIKNIQNKTIYRNEEFQIKSEQDALELTIKKYIPEILEIKNDEVYLNPNLIQYFKSKEVPFSKGNKVNFESEQKDEIIKNLSKRIYLTRNSIVHSKDNDKEKYKPFKDDKDLVPEVLLIRLLAEKIIINTSEQI